MCFHPNLPLSFGRRILSTPGLCHSKEMEVCGSISRFNLALLPQGTLQGSDSKSWLQGRAHCLPVSPLTHHLNWHHHISCMLQKHSFCPSVAQAVRKGLHAGEKSRTKAHGCASCSQMCHMKGHEWPWTACFLCSSAQPAAQTAHNSPTALAHLVPFGCSMAEEGFFLLEIQHRVKQVLFARWNPVH